MHDGAVDRLHRIEQPRRQSALVRRNGVHRGSNHDPPRSAGRCTGLMSEPFQVADDGFHAGDVFVDVRARFELVRRDVGNEVLAKSGQPVDGFGAAPDEAHVRRENLVARAHEIIAVDRLDVDRPMRPEVHRVEKHLSAGCVREPCHVRHVDAGTRGIRRHRARDESCPLRQQRLEIGGIQAAVIANLPADDARAEPFECDPGRHVGFVIQFADDDLGAGAQRLGDREADRADEGRGIEAEGDFGGRARVDEGGNRLACPRDHRVDLLRSAVRAAALHVARDEMIGHRGQDNRGHLRAGGVVEKQEVARLRQRRELSSKIVDRKCHHSWAPSRFLMRAYRMEMSARNGRNDGTVYWRPSTKKVVIVMATRETIPNVAATRCAGILIGSRATCSGVIDRRKRR